MIAIFKKILKLASQHKIVAGIIVILLIVAGYFGIKALRSGNQAVSYVFASVEKGTIISSVSGSGQVSSLNQIDIKAKTSGDAIYVGAKNGQQVKSGALLIQLDTSDTQKTVRDAEISLQRAQLRA